MKVMQALHCMTSYLAIHFKLNLSDYFCPRFQKYPSQIRYEGIWNELNARELRDDDGLKGWKRSMLVNRLLCTFLYNYNSIKLFAIKMHLYLIQLAFSISSGKKHSSKICQLNITQNTLETFGCKSTYFYVECHGYNIYKKPFHLFNERLNVN